METILFLCPHNAAKKGVMAEAYFNHRVQQEGLPFLLYSVRTEPFEQIWPTVIELLQCEGIPLTSWIPRKVTRNDILYAFQLISLGCAIEEVEGLPRQFTLWEDVPLASTDLLLSWMAIRHHVDQLIADLARATKQAHTETSASLMDRKTT
jgi:protein-tyrosine-phosphatase